MAHNKRKNRIANTLAVCFWLCAWQAASVCIGQKLILVSPLEVCGALLALLPTADFWQTAAFSAGRIIGGFLLALALGLALAALAAALPFTAGPRYGGFALGAAAFAISDVFVAKDALSGATDRQRNGALLLYYLAVYAMAFVQLSSA